MLNNFTQKISRQFLISGLCCLLVFPVASFAGNKVVVIPLIGNSSELKPIRPSDLIEVSRNFTQTTDTLVFGTVTSGRGIIISSIMVSPRKYPASLQTIELQFHREGFYQSLVNVPNNTVTTLDFGIGKKFTNNGEYSITIPSRGGLATGSYSDLISVFVSGYYFDK